MRIYVLSKSKIILGLWIVMTTFFGCKEENITPPPTVTILVPATGAIVDKAFTVEVAASANDGIHSVELYANNILVGKAEVEPYKFTIDISGYDLGSYAIRAVAYSNSRKTRETDITITITKPTLPKPLEFEASKGQFGNKVVLNWHQVPGATSYQIFKQDNATKEYAKIGESSENVFEDVNVVEPLVQYFYKVRAYNSATVYGEFGEYDYGHSNGKKYDLVLAFGSEGTATNQFGLVTHIGYKNNKLYVTDWYNQRIVKYNPDGTGDELVKYFTQNVNPTGPYFYGDEMIVGSCNYDKRILFINDSMDIRDFKTNLQATFQITMDDSNFIYVTGDNKVTKYDLDGNIVLQWGTRGDLPGQFYAVWGIVYYHNSIVVSNYFSGKIQFFTTNGEFIKEWTLANNSFDIIVKDDYLYIACGNFIAKTDYEGTVIERIYGAFTSATSIAIDEQQNIFVTDPYQRKIYVYKKN
jgi:hypothetical protein